MVEAALPSINGGKNEDSPQRALQFAILKQNEITITVEAMEYLGQFPCDQKLSIVTLVGPVNSGKSLLASKLAGAADSCGFPTRDQSASSADAAGKPT